MFVHLSWHVVYKILEMTGYAGAGAAVIYGALRWMTAVFKKLNVLVDSLADVPTINTNVNTIMTNHLPHLNAAVEESQKHFDTLRTDFQGVVTSVTGLDKTVAVLASKQETNEDALHRLGEMFVRHIDGSKTVEVHIENPKS
jgi:hypothetical protein